MRDAQPREVLLANLIAHLAAHGLGDTSLRSLASGVGTSHRMLIYHFGSREGVLAAVVDVMARRQLAEVGVFLRTDGDAEPDEVAWSAWCRLADDANIFTPLLFELSAHAMIGRAWAGPLADLVDQGAWRLALFFEKVGYPPERAQRLGRTAMALARGSVFDLALTGDRVSADAVMRDFLESALGPRAG